MPKIVDHEQKKMEIAASACVAIAEMGIEKANLIEIGKQAGCTTGAITHYFADKDEVLIAAWDYAYRQLMKQIERISSRKPYSLIDVLSESLPTKKRTRILTKVWMTLTIRSLDSVRLAKKQISVSKLWNKRIEEELRKAQALGELYQHIDLEYESQVISIVINGISLRAIIDPKSWPSTRQKTTLRNYIVHLMSNQNGTMNKK
jgi:AcrR family transcriptional regulator